VIDHIIYGAPDLERALTAFGERYGVQPTPGGRHPGFGTRNALAGLAGDRYLEIMSVDHTQDVAAHKRFFGLDSDFEPRFVAWCARSARPLEETVAIAREAGADPGEILSMSRARPDGTELAWRLTSPFATREGGVLPFYIDWGTTPNPASTMAPVLTLESLVVVHPEPARIRRILAALGEHEPDVAYGPAPSLTVILRASEQTISPA
jgi:hypothetical protein